MQSLGLFKNSIKKKKTYSINTNTKLTDVSMKTILLYESLRMEKMKNLGSSYVKIQTF